MTKKNGISAEQAKSPPTLISALHSTSQFHFNNQHPINMRFNYATITRGLLLLALLSVYGFASAQTLVWAKSMGGQTADYAYAVATDASDNVYTTGTFTGLCDFDPGAADNSLITSGNTDGFVSKLNSSGAYVWAKSFTATSGGLCQPAAIAADASGNTYITGYWHGTVDFDPSATSNTLNNGGTNEDIFIVKLNASGALVWFKSIGNNSNDFGTGIAVDATGNVYITGHFNLASDFDPSANTATLTPVGAQDVFILKLDASGNYVWAKNVGGTGTDYGRAITVDATGNVYTTGSFTGTGDFDPSASTASIASAGFGDAFISKLDASGNYVWAKALGGASADAGYGVAVDASGNVITTGIFTTSIDLDPSAATVTANGFASYDIYISKLDASGNYVWGKVMGGTTGDDLAQGISLDASGNIYTTGSFRGQVDFDPGAGVANLVATGSTAYMSKLYANGTYAGAVRAGTVGYGINVSSTGKVHVAGNYSGTSDFDPSAATSNLTSVLSSNDIYVWKLNRCAAITSSTTASICQGSTYNFNGQTLTTAGSYSTVYNSFRGCDSTVNLTLSVTALPTAAISGNTAICPTVSTTLTASGGTAYAWSNSATTAAITVSPTSTTTYTVTVTNATGCTATASSTVTVSSGNTATITPSASQLTCATTTATLTASNGSTYNWSNSANTAAITVTAAGTYTVTVTGANGCTATASTVITSNTAVPPVSISSPTLITCVNTSTTVTATGASTYSWSNGINTASNTIANAGTYLVTGTGTNGCTASANVLISANTTAPSVAITSPTVLTCTNPTTTFTASGADSYSWVGGSTSASRTVTAAGTYTVTGTSAVNGCTASASVAVTANNTAPSVAVSGAGALTCANPSITLTATGGNAYAWTGGSTASTLTVTAAGTYTVTGTNTTNGCTATASAVVTANANVPTLAINAPNTTLTCATTSLNLTTTATNINTYAWSNSTTASSITVTAPGTYTVTGTNTTNGCTITATVTITQNTTAPSVAVSGAGTLTCSAPSITLSATGANTYAWSNSSSSANTTVTAAGTYIVTGTGSNGCTASASGVVTANTTAPSVSIGGNAQLTCSTTSLTLTATGANTYAWNGGSTNATRTITAAGTYTVTGTGTNGCTASATTTITQNTTAPSIAITGGGTITCATPTLTLNASGANTYVWTGGSTNASLTVNTAGTYTVTGTGSNGCTGVGTVTINSSGVVPSLSIINTNPVLTCSTTSITISTLASNVDIYQWSNNVNTSFTTVTSPGVYTITGTNTSNGCTTTATVTVTQNTVSPTLSITGNTELNCNINSVTLTASGADNYLWPDASNQTTYTVTAPGTYAIAGQTAANGCTATLTFTVTQNTTPPTITLTGVADLTCTSQTSVVSASGADTYIWSDNTNGPITAISTAGSYSVTGTGVNGCTSVESFTISQDTIPATITITGDDVLTCTNSTIVLQANGGVNYLWSDNTNGATTSVSVAGTYTVTGSSNNGCTSTASFSVTQDITAPTAPTIVNNNGTLDAGAGFASYQWINNGNVVIGATSQTYTPTVSGDYAVIVTAISNGCQATSNVVSVPVGLTLIPSLASATLSPNPSDGNVSIQLPQGLDKVQISVFNALGQQVATMNSVQSHNTVSLNLPDMPGLYLVKISSNEQAVTLSVIRN